MGLCIAHVCPSSKWVAKLNLLKLSFVKAKFAKAKFTHCEECFVRIKGLVCFGVYAAVVATHMRVVEVLCQIACQSPHSVGASRHTRESIRTSDLFRIGKLWKLQSYHIVSYFGFGFFVSLARVVSRLSRNIPVVLSSSGRSHVSPLWAGLGPPGVLLASRYLGISRCEPAVRTQVGRRARAYEVVRW